MLRDRGLALRAAPPPASERPGLSELRAELQQHVPGAEELWAGAVLVGLVVPGDEKLGSGHTRALVSFCRDLVGERGVSVVCNEVTSCAARLLQLSGLRYHAFRMDQDDNLGERVRHLLQPIEVARLPAAEAAEYRRKDPRWETELERLPDHGPLARYYGFFPGDLVRVRLVEPGYGVEENLALVVDASTGAAS